MPAGHIELLNFSIPAGTDLSVAMKIKEALDDEISHAHVSLKVMQDNGELMEVACGTLHL